MAVLDTTYLLYEREITKGNKKTKKQKKKTVSKETNRTEHGQGKYKKNLPSGDVVDSS